MISYVKLLLSIDVTYVQDFLVVLTYKLQQQNMVVGNVNIYIVPPFPIGRSDMGGKIKKVWFTYSDTLFSSVFFNSKTALFSCIFWFQDSFICQFTYLHLLSGLQGKICQQIYDSPKTILSIKCLISMSHIILEYPYYYKKVVSELYKSSQKSYFLPIYIGEKAYICGFQ